MKKQSGLAMCVVAGLMCAGGSAELYGQERLTYQVDDGTGGNAGPLNVVGSLVWGNVFDVATSGGGGGVFDVITEIHVAVGRLPTGQRVDALLFEIDDARGQTGPDGATLLREVSFVPTATSSNVFTVVPITPTRVSGKFYVAARTNIDGTNQTWPARTDFQTGGASGFRTYFYWGPMVDLANLGASANRANYVNVATALVRAVGTVSGACAADVGGAGGAIGGDGVADNNDFVAFVSLFFGGDLRADVGSQGGLEGADGALDSNDFVAFVAAFFGC